MSQRSINDIISATALDVHPPAFYILLKLWIAFVGQSSDFVRLLPALCCGICVALTPRLAREFNLSTRTGLIAAALLAFNPFWLRHTLELRMYGLASVLVLLSTIMMLELVAADSPSAKQKVGLGVVYALALLTHYYTVFIMVLHLGYVVMQHRHVAWQHLRLPLSVAAGLFSLWLPTLLRQIRLVQEEGWMLTPNLADAMNVPYRQIFFSHLADGTTIQVLGFHAVILGFIYAAINLDNCRAKTAAAPAIFGIAPVFIVYILSQPPLPAAFADRLFTTYTVFIILFIANTLAYTTTLTWSVRVVAASIFLYCMSYSWASYILSNGRNDVFQVRYDARVIVQDIEAAESMVPVVAASTFIYYDLIANSNFNIAPYLHDTTRQPLHESRVLLRDRPDRHIDTLKKIPAEYQEVTYVREYRDPLPSAWQTVGEPTYYNYAVSQRLRRSTD